MAAGHLGDAAPEFTGGSSADVAAFRDRVEAIISRVDELEKRVAEVSRYYGEKRPLQDERKGVISAGKVKGKAVAGCQRKHAEVTGGRREGMCSKRMHELMRQLGTILRQIMAHKWAWPFLDPVDVEGLELHDYYEVVKNPMDFSTIKNKMELKDNSVYKSAREIYADIRLVFTNAMAYNSMEEDIHMMAKTLLEKFEEKWNLLLPKVIEEENRQKKAEVQIQEDLQIKQHAAMTNMALATNGELDELNRYLEDLRDAVIKKCRKLSLEEKRGIVASTSRLNNKDDFAKALSIMGKQYSDCIDSTQTLHVNLDSQPEAVMWRLKFFTEAKLDVQAKDPAKQSLYSSNRTREICDAFLAKKRRTKI